MMADNTKVSFISHNDIAPDVRKMRLLMMLMESESSEDESDGDMLEVVGAAVACMERYKPREKRHRQSGYVADVADTFRLDEFKTFFRLSRASVQYIEEYIAEVCSDENVVGIIHPQSAGGTPQKSLRDRLLMVLWFMASLDKYAAVADRFGMSESTACCAIRNLLEFFHHYLMEKVILWPSANEQNEIQDMYFNLKGFPGVIGMIDGTHITIKKPKVRGVDYYNRKDYYSMVLQAVVREDMRFTSIYTGWPGKVHDARVFRHSPLFQNGQLMCGQHHILGDSAYPNLPFLLTPFRDNGHLTPIQVGYNKTHCSIRSTVERAFGLLKGRFTRLTRLDQRDIATTINTIIGGCVLHNICIMKHEDIPDLLEDEPIPQMQANVANFDANAQLAAANKRLAIARDLGQHQ